MTGLAWALELPTTPVSDALLHFRSFHQVLLSLLTLCCSSSFSPHRFPASLFPFLIRIPFWFFSTNYTNVHTSILSRGPLSGSIWP